MQNNILDTLIALGDYYHITRQSGHTTLMLQGSEHYDAPHVILTHTEQMNHLLKETKSNTPSHKKYYKSLSSNLSENLRGLHYPLAIDNAAMEVLINESIIEIEKQKNLFNLQVAKNNKLSDELKNIKTYIEKLEKLNDEVSKENAHLIEKIEIINKITNL